MAYSSLPEGSRGYLSRKSGTEFPSKSFTVVAIVMVIAFAGLYRFPGFCGNQHIRDPTWSQDPFLKRLGNGSRSCFVGFRCFGKTSRSLHFALICVHLPSFSFDLHASSFYFAVISFHSPFTFLLSVFMSNHFPLIFLSFLIPMCIHVLSSSFHLHAGYMFLSFCIQVLSFLSKVVEMALWLWLGQGDRVAKVLAK